MFLDVWRQAGQFEARSPVSTWLLEHRALQGALGAAAAPEEELDDETAGAIEDHGDDPEVAAAEEG